MIYRTAEKLLRNFGGLCDYANIQYISDSFSIRDVSSTYHCGAERAQSQ